MEKKPIRKFTFRRFAAIILLVFVLFVSLLLLPVTQTFLGNRLAANVADKFGTNVTLGKVKVSPFGNATFRDVLAIDHKQDTLIYIGFLQLSAFRLQAVLQGDNNLGDALLSDVECNIITYKDEEKSNINQFFKRFSRNKEKSQSSAPFYLSSIRLTNSNLFLQNQNKSTNTSQEFTSLNAAIENFKIVTGEISASIVQLDTNTPWKNTQITSLSGDYAYSPTSMKLTEATLQTASSTASFDLQLTYPKKGLSTFAETVAIDMHIKAADLGNDALSLVSPSLPFKNGSLSGNIRGTLQDLSAKDLFFQTGANQLKLSGTSKNLFSKKPTLSGDWSVVIVESNQVVPTTVTTKTSAFIRRLGSLTSSGTFSAKNHIWNINTKINAAIGKLDTDIRLDAKDSNLAYKLDLYSKNIDLGTLIAVETLGTTGLDVSLRGKGLNLDKLNAAAKGTLTNFHYRGHAYDLIELEGYVNPQLFNGNLDVVDQAAKLNLSGKVNFDTIRNFSFTSNVTYVDLPAVGWTDNTATALFSGSIDLALQGNTLDEMIGDLYIEDGKLQTEENIFDFSSLALQSRLNDGVRVINISSDDVASGVMIGLFKPTELVKLLQNAAGAQYPHYKPYAIAPNQYVDFNFNIRNKIAAALFGNAVSLDNNTFIKGSIHSQKDLLALDIRIPSLVVKDTELYDFTLKLDSKNSEQYSLVSIDKIVHDRGEVKELLMSTQFVDGFMHADTKFNMSNTSERFSHIKTTFTFDDDSRAVLGVEQANLVFYDKLWKLKDQSATPLLTFSDVKNFALSEMSLTNNNSAVSLTASRTGNDTFSLNMDFTSVMIDEILSFKKNKWTGTVDGFLNITQSSNGIEGNSNLSIQDVQLNSTRLGDATLTLQSEQGAEAYQMAFRLEENATDVVVASGSIGVTQQKPKVDMMVSFYEYNLSLLAGLTTNVFNPFSGNANGSIHLFTVGDALIADGVMDVDNLSLTVPYLNTRYDFTKPVPFVFAGSKVNIVDAPFIAQNSSQSGILDGSFSHQSFDNWSLDMQIDAQNLNVLNTDFTQTALYYGDAYFTGNAHLHGPFTNMQIDVIGQTAKGTNMFIPIQYDTAIGDVSYINFVEKQEVSQSVEEFITNVKGLQLNFDLDVTPDAQVEIVVDPETKSFLRGRGAGNMLLEIDTSGSFAMWGDFIAFDGIYNFKNLGLIDKKFTLEPGGTIVWEGDPLGAQINMRAVYDVPGGANPAVLLEGDNISQKIPTEVTINLFGNLLNPETPTFEIDFPNTSGVVKNELNYRLNDQERRQLQAISLLSQSSFINEVSLAAISSQTLTNNLFQKASGVFDNIFASENDQLNLSLNYLQGDRNAAVSIKNRDRLGLSLSTNINERILIDGKVGVPVGSEDETMIIGNVTLEFLLNPQGSLRARIFNKENEFQYFGDELGYTQGVGVSYQVRFNSFNELTRKIFNKK